MIELFADNEINRAASDGFGMILQDFPDLFSAKSHANIRVSDNYFIFNSVFVAVSQAAVLRGGAAPSGGDVPLYVPGRG